MKKAVPTVLQTEVRSQEEWDQLMQRKGLGVVDVYSSWCGPCKAIISLFRKIRNEQDDDLLFFATAETDTIESLVDYRGKSQPTFLFYGDGQLVNVMRGCDGPMITKLIKILSRKERQILEGICEREIFIDKVVSKEPEVEEKQDSVKEDVDEAEEEIVLKKVTVAIIKPDGVQAGVVEQILEQVVAAGYDILRKLDHSFTKEEVAELFRQDETDNFEQLIEFMTSGSSVVLAISKSGDVIGEDIIAEIITLCGPVDVNTAKEEAPESLRAKFGTDTLRNAIHSSLSEEDATRELALFFPDIEVPTFQNLIQQKTLQRTVALIRPNAYAMKETIIKTIEDNGFVIAIEKEMEFTKEKAEEFYSQHKDEEIYESLITNMTSGPCIALCLVKNNAVQVWKDLLSPTQIIQEPVEGDESEQLVSLQVKFAIPEDTSEPLHASDSIAEFEREMKILFALENVVLVIQPDSCKNDVEKGAILLKIKLAGFNIVVQKEVTMSIDQAAILYKEDAEKEFFEELKQYMSSGPSLFLILSREDAMDGLQKLLGPSDPGKAKEISSDTIRGQFGKDEIRNSVYGSTSKESVLEVIKEFCADVVFDEQGLVSEPVPGNEPSEEVIEENTQSDPIGETAQAVEEGDAVITEEGPDETAAEPTVDSQGPTAEDDSANAASSEEVSREPTLLEPTTEEASTEGDSSVPPSREPTTDGATEEPTSTEVSREGTLNETGGEAGDTKTSNTDTDTA